MLFLVFQHKSGTSYIEIQNTLHQLEYICTIDKQPDSMNTNYATAKISTSVQYLASL